MKKNIFFQDNGICFERNESPMLPHYDLPELKEAESGELEETGKTIRFFHIASNLQWNIGIYGQSECVMVDQTYYGRMHARWAEHKRLNSDPQDSGD